MTTTGRQTDREERGDRARAVLVRRLFEAAVDEQIDDTALEQTAAEIAGQLEAAGDTPPAGLSILFHDGGIYVDRQLLRADRPVYTSFRDLESFLGKFRCNEIAFEPGYSDDDVVAVAEALRRMDRHPLAVTEPIEPTDASAIRYAQPAERVGLLEPLTGQRPLEVRIARYYAACLQTLRTYHGTGGDERTAMLDEITRISQVLVHLSGRSRPAMLSLVGLREARDEFCGVVLDSAILALLMARRLTGHLATLRRICFAALTVDAANHPGRDEPRLPGQGPRRSAARSTAELLASSRTSETWHRRAVELHEIHSLLEAGPEGLAYEPERSPKIESLLVKVARRYTYLGAKPPSTVRRGTPDEIVQTMLHRADGDHELMVLHLLVDTLGLFTMGMPVALSSGWRGVVVSAAEHITNFHLPRVRLARNPDGEWVEPREVDLSNIDEETYGYVTRRLEEPGDKMSRLQQRVLEDESLSPE